MMTRPHKKYRFIKLIRFWGIVFLAVLAAIIIGIDLTISYHDLSVHIDNMRASHIEQQKRVSKREVERVVNLIKYEIPKSEILTKSKIKTKVDEASAIVESIYQRNKTVKSDFEIQQMIIDALRLIRFENGSGYYFVIGIDGVGLLLPEIPEIEGSNLLNLKDAHGHYIIRDSIDIAKKYGEGFYEYYWIKPQSGGRDFKKLSFIKRFEQYNWFIGTSLYVDDIEEQIKAKWMERINTIRYGKNQVGYLFAADWHGKSLAHGAQPDLIGQNGWEWEDSKGNKTSQMLIAASKKKDGGFVNFWWRKPDTGKESAKIAYAKAVPEWQLFIASGVYIEDIDQSVIPLQKALNAQTQTKIVIFITVVALAFILFFITFHFLSNRLRKDLNLFGSFIDQMAFSDKKIDRRNIQFAELDQMAESANKMITERKKAEEEIHSAKLFIDRVVDMSPYAMWISDNQGIVIRTNNSLRKTLNATDENIVGKYNILKDKNMEEHGVLPMVMAVFENHEPTNFTIPWEAAKGGDVNFEDAPDLYMDVSIFPIVNAEGRLTNAVCQWVDITKHKQNEESLRERTQELDFSREETIQRLARAAEFRDNETAEHNQRMSHYCKILAEGFGMSAEQCEKIRLASVMHDIGKIGISDLVLLKPGRFMDEELSLIKTHPEIGYRILSGSRSPLLELGAVIAFTHHEKYDGSGYPRQLAGVEIPVEGRIAAVADVFDALTSNRIYREAWSIDRTLELIVREKGAHFDPLFVDLFLESMDDVLQIKKRHADGSATTIGSPEQPKY
jgi:HD-GYP domain-containing protein (c-di-GMP phosphodiesterase class II)/signal transduction histidine kinase